VRDLALIVGEPLTPLREHQPFGLKVRIEHEHRRLLKLQHERDQARQARHAQTFAAQPDRDSEAQLRAFWNET